MKFLLFSLWLSLSLMGCGKETKEKGRRSDQSEISDAELQFTTLIAVKEAVFNNDLLKLKEALEKNPRIDLDQILDNGETFLTSAIKNNYPGIRDYLLEKNANVDAPNVRKETPLIIAIQNSQQGSVRSLLSKRVDVERKDAEGNSPVHLAIKTGQDEIALMLLKQGANMEAIDRQGDNAFKLCTENNVPKTLDFIRGLQNLDIGAPSIATYRNILASGDEAMLARVLKKYPRIAVDEIYESFNPLSILIDLKDEETALKMMKLLLEAKAQADGPKGVTVTPLVHAVEAEKIKFIELLLKHGADIHWKGREGKTALIEAIEENNLEIVTLLLSYNAQKKYVFRKNGYVISYNACDIAELMEDRISSTEDLATNSQIQKTLDCSFFRRRWPL